MKGHLLMSAKARRWKSAFDEVLAGRLGLKEAARRLGLSYRQARRLYKRFRDQGDAGLVHRSRGKPSNRGYPASFKAQVQDRYEECYKPLDMGPTLAAEKLAENDDLHVDHETLRRWLLEKDLWQRRRKRAKHRSWRERKAHFGELVQMDGSPHRWFGGEHPEACLMNMVDDATGVTLSLLADHETTEVSMRLLWAWIECNGIPQALYTDKKNIFVTSREPTLEEQLAGEEPRTAFGKACAKLGIEIITAHSPQAKGRVERNHGVYQDRFVKELALQGITAIENANRLLTNGFSDTLNVKFARKPLSDVDYHRPVPDDINLEDVFCHEFTRQVQNDWTIRFENQYYQIEKDNAPLPRPKDKVVMRIRLDATRHILYKGRPLNYRKLEMAELKRRADSPETSVDNESRVGPKKKTPTTPRHPWRRRALPLAADSTRK